MPKPPPKTAAKKPVAVTPPSAWNNIPLLGALIAAIAFLIYANTLGHGYALDDVAVIHQNKFVKSGISGIPDILSTFYWAGYWELNSGLYRPLSLIMFAVEWELFPGQPFIGHFMNVLLYALACYLLFKVLLRLFKNYSPVFSFAITLLFALHPVHTEVVANIKSRDEILCLLFFLLSVQQLLNYLRDGKMISQIYMALFFFFSLMSKEGGLLFLLIYPLILYFFSKTSWKKIGTFMVPFVVIATVWYGLHEWVISQAPLDRKPYTYVDNSMIAAPDFMSRTATAFSIMGRYFRLLVFPHPLAYDYSFNQVPNVSWSNPGALFSLAICIGLLVVAFRGLRQKSILSFAILFFFITISLTSNIVKIIGATMADRFLFVPSLGFCIAIVWLIHHYWAKKKQQQQVMVYAFLPVFLLFGFKTWSRNKDWKNDYTLFLHDVHSSPNSGRTHYNAATAMLGDGINEKDPVKKTTILTKVTDELEASLKIDSAYASAWMNYGVALFHLNLFEQSVTATSNALRLNPGDSSLFHNLGDAYVKLNRNDSAIFYINRSIRAGIVYKNTYNNLGMAYFNLQQFDKSIESYRAGIQRDSTFAELWLNLGNVYGITQHYPEANTAFEKAYALDPSNPQPLRYIAITYQNMGNTEKADEYLARFNAATQPSQ